MKRDPRSSSFCSSASLGVPVCARLGMCSCVEVCAYVPCVCACKHSHTGACAFALECMCVHARCGGTCECLHMCPAWCVEVGMYVCLECVGSVLMFVNKCIRVCVHAGKMTCHCSTPLLESIPGLVSISSHHPTLTLEVCVVTMTSRVLSTSLGMSPHKDALHLHWVLVTMK